MAKKKSKLRRISVLMMILWIPITIILESLGVFGDYGEDWFVFFFGGFLLFLILTILGPWVEKAFNKEE